ncbi:probable apyrase 6 [Elaeis guineensis]|uniref:Probable apyrase 6 n=1 Tax=Elaeis guineensis var. tenera TaxID=51953 RepID=A0A6I9R330_ELAGV|nr:probable apyrase 6 [Elaeis guineensis]
MDAPKLLIRPVPPRPSLLSRISPPAHRHHRGTLWILVAAAAAMAVVIFLLIASLSSPSPRFGIVIDAGSSGTRIHVFGFNGESGMIPSIDWGSTAVMRVTPGLSAFSGEPERARASLAELLEFAKGRVAKDQWGKTDVRLMATAGLRMLPVEVRDSILESCRMVLRSSGFRFQDDWASVIPGSDEGIYAWVAANYALNTLGGDPQKTTGIIELGGASAQVTFVSNEALPAEFLHVLKFGETTYNLYSNSFLHYGQNAAHESLQKLLRSRSPKASAESVQEGLLIDPCSPKGYSYVGEPADVPNSKLEHQPIGQAGGNFSACRSAASMLLQKEKENCLYQKCHMGSTFIPKLQGSFVATENFFFTTKFFGLSPTSSLSDLMLAGEQFCGEDWSKLKEKYHTLAEEDLSRYCFSSAYIVALLHDSLGITLDDRRIEFANQVGNIQVEWALGAFIMQTMATRSYHSGWITSVVQPDSLVLLFVASTLLIFAAWLASKWRRPQLKTIYDLEKGRYIVTRVN